MDGGTAGGQFEVNTGFNRMRVNYDATNGGDRQTASATVSGGISATRAGVYLTRPLDQSVAVVEVEGLKDVRILVDNTPVGHTGGSGKLLINELLPYLANRISYEEADIPFDYKVPVSSQLVAPPYHGAAYVKFKTARIQAPRRDGGADDWRRARGAQLRRDCGDSSANRQVESPLNGRGSSSWIFPSAATRPPSPSKGRAATWSSRRRRAPT